MKPLDLLKIIVRAIKLALALTEKELHRYEKIEREEGLKKN